MMHYKNLGKSPLKVSRLCLGSMMFADQTDLAEARLIVEHAHAHGCNFIDTADIYSHGKSEQMVGELKLSSVEFLSKICNVSEEISASVKM